jgi:hypothetical protein
MGVDLSVRGRRDGSSGNGGGSTPMGRDRGPSDLASASAAEDGTATWFFGIAPPAVNTGTGLVRTSSRSAALGAGLGPADGSQSATVARPAGARSRKRLVLDQLAEDNPIVAARLKDRSGAAGVAAPPGGARRRSSISSTETRAVAAASMAASASPRLVPPAGSAFPASPRGEGGAPSLPAVLVAHTWNAAQWQTHAVLSANARLARDVADLRGAVAELRGLLVQLLSRGGEAPGDHVASLVREASGSAGFAPSASE